MRNLLSGLLVAALSLAPAWRKTPAQAIPKLARDSPEPASLKAPVAPAHSPIRAAAHADAAIPALHKALIPPVDLQIAVLGRNPRIRRTRERTTLSGSVRSEHH